MHEFVRHLDLWLRLIGTPKYCPNTPVATLPLTPLNEAVYQETLSRVIPNFNSNLMTINMTRYYADLAINGKHKQSCYIFNY